MRDDIGDTSMYDDIYEDDPSYVNPGGEGFSSLESDFEDEPDPFDEGENVIDQEFETSNKKTASFDEDEDFDEDKIVSKNAIVEALLKQKGIEDYNKIQFENDEGEIEYHNFYDLEPEEQLAILQSSEADINYGLSEDEVETINLLRSNNVSFAEVVEIYKRQGIEEYLREAVSESFSVDQMSNEELFILDLQSKYEDLTEDELDIELQKELTRPELFEKKMNTLRQQYIETEAQKIEYDNNVAETAKEQQFNLLVDSLVESAIKLEDLGGLDLSDNDKDDVLDFILNRDANGVSSFFKSINDHDSLFKMAWFVVKGEEAFAMLHDYYKGQIDQVRRNTYEKAKKELGSSSPVFKDTKPAPKRRFDETDNFFS